MGKLAVYKYFSFMLLVITLMTSVFTFIGLYGGYASPARETAMAIIVLMLPIFVIGNVVTLAIWLIRRRWHWAVIPFVTLLWCIPYIGTFYQSSLFSSNNPDKSNLTIASYNVALFGREVTGFKADDILSEMKDHKVDILCLQEFMEQSGDHDNTATYLNSFGHMAKGRDDMAVFSRYPIVQSGTITFGPSNNSAMWADVRVNNRVVRVFNVHLETTGINRTLHKAAKNQIQGAPVDRAAFLSAIYGNFVRGMAVRAVQADTLARYTSASPHPVILCGDFNDVPYSYTYRTMKGNLVDAFTECGSGLMSTLRGEKRFRIDYIFHDESLRGVNFFKMKLSYSDHDPIFLTLAF